jgi:hypothetical protein
LGIKTYEIASINEIINNVKVKLIKEVIMIEREYGSLYSDTPESFQLLNDCRGYSLDIFSTSSARFFFVFGAVDILLGARACDVLSINRGVLAMLPMPLAYFRTS